MLIIVLILWLDIGLGIWVIMWMGDIWLVGVVNYKGYSLFLDKGREKRWSNYKNNYLIWICEFVYRCCDYGNVGFYEYGVFLILMFIVILVVGIC